MVILQKRVPGLSESSLDRFVTRAKRLAGLRGAVTILITSSAELRRLNQRFRGLNKPTDVLSFPPPVTMAAKFAGDVAISAQIAAQNARRLRHSVAEEIKILSLHGLLHLAGYDHQSDKGTMARREAQLRTRLGLPVGLIERATGEEKILNRRGRGELPQKARRSQAATGRKEMGGRLRGRAVKARRNESVRTRKSPASFSGGKSRRLA